MIKKIFLPAFFSVFLFPLLFVYSQNGSPGLYMPRNLKAAYEKGTRSYDGKPGKNYWQNGSDYKIEAQIDTATLVLTGHEWISYHNNSPDTLTQLVIRLYPDFYRKGNSRDFEIPADAVTNGTTLNKVIVAGNEIAMDGDKPGAKRAGTNLFITGIKPIPPTASVNLEFQWSFTIPKLAPVRMGAFDNYSYMVAYWYPQMAVYDDIDGWDTYNYGGQVEFYNDFSNYDVKITTPKNFIVWSTGVLQNPEETFSDKILKRYNEAHSSDSVVNIIKEEDLSGDLTTDKPNIVWHYKAEDVSDFAFSESNHYLWDASSVLVDKKNGRKTFVSAAYKKDSKDFYEVASIAAKSIKYYSEEIPGWPFPYPQETVFNGSGGMEFPMMVNDGSIKERSGTVHVTSHEIAHTYFPFYMGINERKYAWMDEGWATMLPFQLQHQLQPDYDPLTRNSKDLSIYAGTETEEPMMVPSVLLSGVAYRTASYRRPGAAYEILRDLLGTDTFLKALHGYIDRWHGKHPIPYDFFYSFNDVTGQNLDWFWKPWFFQTGYPDLAVKEVKNKNEIVIQNKGTLPVPVSIEVTYDDGKTETIYKTAEVWKNGSQEISIKSSGNGKIKKVILGTSKIPDVNLKDNELDMK